MEMISAIKKLLHHSWTDIEFKYEGLTAAEKELITPKEFEQALEWLSEKEEDRPSETHVWCQMTVPLQPVPKVALEQGPKGLRIWGQSGDPFKRKKVSSLLRKRGISPDIFLTWTLKKRIDILLNAQLTEIVERREYPKNQIPTGWIVVEL